MALWRIRRLENQPESLTSLECIAPEIPMAVTMHDDDTGAEEVSTLCWDPTSPTAAQDLLDTLRVAGYDPSDWHGA